MAESKKGNGTSKPNTGGRAPATSKPMTTKPTAKTAARPRNKSGK